MVSDRLKPLKIVGMALAIAMLGACAGGSGARDESGAQMEAAGVNRYLWRASLDTIEFMPIANADPVSGLILTDWYSSPQVPNERFRANVYILDTALRADALRVSLFRQERAPGGWIDAQANRATAREIENAILSRARQLRLSSDFR